MIRLRDIEPGAYLVTDFKTPGADQRVPTLFEVEAVNVSIVGGGPATGTVALVNCSTEAEIVPDVQTVMREYTLVRKRARAAA